VQVVVEEFVGRSPGAGMKIGQPLSLHGWVAADRAGITDEGGELRAFHVRGDVGQERRTERNAGKMIAQAVDLENIGDDAGHRAESDQAGAENQIEQKGASRDNLLIAFRDHVTCVTIVPFSPSRICCHEPRSLARLRTSHFGCAALEIVSRKIVSIWPGST
jgi:hypothetical protein